MQMGVAQEGWLPGEMGGLVFGTQCAHSHPRTPHAPGPATTGRLLCIRGWQVLPFSQKVLLSPLQLPFEGPITLLASPE